LKNRSRYTKKQESGWLSRFDIFIPVVILLSMINPLRAMRSQYYILEYPDDIVWMHFAQEHFNNISGLLTDKIGTGFRPTNKCALLYRLFSVGLKRDILLSDERVALCGCDVIPVSHHTYAAQQDGRILAVMLYLFLDASFILVWR